MSEVTSGGTDHGDAAAATLSVSADARLPNTKAGKVTYAQELKAKGNTLFGQGKFKKARKAYRSVFLYLDGLSLPHSGETQAVNPFTPTNPFLGEKASHGEQVDGWARKMGGIPAKYQLQPWWKSKDPSDGMAAAESSDQGREENLGTLALETRIRVRCNLAKCELKLGRQAQAMEQARKAIAACKVQANAPRQNGPANALMWAKAFFVLGKACLATGDGESAGHALAAAEANAASVTRPMDGQEAGGAGGAGGARGGDSDSGGVGCKGNEDAASGDLHVLVSKSKALRKQVRVAMKKALALEREARRASNAKWKAAMHGSSK